MVASPDKRTQLKELTPSELLQLDTVIRDAIRTIVVADKSIELEGIGKVGWELRKEIEVSFGDGLPLAMPSGVGGYWSPSPSMRETIVPLKSNSPLVQLFRRLSNYRYKSSK